MAETSGEGSAGGETVEAPPPPFAQSLLWPARGPGYIRSRAHAEPARGQPSPISLPGQASGLPLTLPVPTEAGTVASAGKAAFKLGG